MPNHHEISEFQVLLRDATLDNQLEWEPTPDGDTFRTRLPNGSFVRLSHERLPFAGDSATTEEYLLSLLNPNGYVVEEWSQPDLGDLHRLARNSALKLNETLQDAINSLRKVRECKS